MKIDLHKFALSVGFEVVCVDDDFTNYEYMVRLRDIESMSYVLKIKNVLEFEDVDNVLQSIIVVLPSKLRRKVRRLMRKKDKENIDNLIDLICYTVDEYKAKTDYSKLKEYGQLVGINIEDFNYHFEFKTPKKKYTKIISLIESKLPVEYALVVGRFRKIDFKISYLKQHLNKQEEI